MNSLFDLEEKRILEKVKVAVAGAFGQLQHFILLQDWVLRRRLVEFNLI